MVFNNDIEFGYPTVENVDETSGTVYKKPRARYKIPVITYEVDGTQLVVKVDGKETRRANPHTGLQNLRNYLNVQAVIAPPLPRNCRFFFGDENSRLYVIELKPGYFTIEHNTEFEDSGIVEVTLPWQYFVFSFTKPEYNRYDIEWTLNLHKLFWSLGRLNTINDRVSVARVLNVGESGDLCLGDTYPESDLSCEERVEEMVEAFYSHGSTFNDDMGFRIPYGTMRSWANVSKKTPLWWKNNLPMGHPLKDWIVFPNTEPPYLSFQTMFDMVFSEEEEKVHW
jgi:hypothetical protein